MTPYSRLLSVIVSAAVAGLVSFGPMPGNAAVAAAAPASPVATAEDAAPATGLARVAGLPGRAGLSSSALKTTTGSRAVTLTFDDGPDPKWTPRILSLLRAQKVKATFCLVGSRVRAYPQLVRAIVHDGHTLCNHTMNHDLGLRNKSTARIAADLAQTNTLIRRAAGVTPRYFRAPGGNWSSRIVAVAARQGMKPLHWAVDPQDWRRPPAARIVATVKSHTKPGSIILLHDSGGDRRQTEAAVRTLLPYLKARFRLASL